MNNEILNNLAARVAVAMNGGNWNTHYTEAQKQLWRDRITGMIGGSNERLGEAVAGYGIPWRRV